MELEMCPYCESRGLLLTVKTIPGGIEINGRCNVCAYTCDSDFAPQEEAYDLLADYSIASETSARS